MRLRDKHDVGRRDHPARARHRRLRVVDPLPTPGRRDRRAAARPASVASHSGRTVTAGTDRVIRATELVGRPVVTLAGDDVAEVRDVVYDAERGTLLGFTLNKRGWFRGRLHERLPVASVHAIGRDAVMVSADRDLVAPDDA